MKRDIYIKDFIGIVLSFLISVVFSYMILLQMSNILYMTVACTVIFNLICLVVSRSKGKAAGEIAVSVGCYILYNLFL
jgi:ABC-type bacteriocin/lantibiotic exporter with double-glycine peptidase domain